MVAGYLSRVPAAHRNEPDPVEAVDGADAAATPVRRTGRRWRVGTPVMLLMAGSLFAVSATNSEGTDLRPGRYTDLASLTESESRSYQRLQEQAADLEAEVDRLTRGVDDERVRKAERRAERLRAKAGLVPVSGEGISIVMSDASDEALEEAIKAAGDNPDSADLRPLVVHQQDIQAVVNALWAGGARAVTIQGQRIVTTTGIKCTGSAVQLQGVPYPEPYTIEAVGDPESLQAALDADAWVGGYRADAERPEVGVGWELDESDDIEAPAYAGLLDVELARPQRA